MNKRKKIGLNQQKGLWGYAFVLPLIIGLVLIFLPALFKSLIYSFHDVKIEFNNINMVYKGFQNYYDAFMTDSKFRVVLLDGSRGIFLDTLVIIFFSFFIAIVLNQKFSGRGFARAVFFLPVVLTSGIVAVVENENQKFNAMDIISETQGDQFGQMGMQAMFNTYQLMSQIGIPNSISEFIASTINNTYHIVNGSGVQILVFLTALQAISPSVFEAAKVEGATKWEEFWKITFPMLSPMILVNIVYTMIDTFTNPIYGVMAYIETQAFSSGKMGYAAALSWIYFAVVLIALGITTAIVSRRVTYLD